MSARSNYIVNAHINGDTYVYDISGFGFRHTDVTQFTVSKKSSFLHFKERIESKIMSGPVSQIIYKNPIFLKSRQVKYFQHKVRDNEDVQSMFESHEHSGFDYIELYILLSQSQQSQNFDEYQVLNQSKIFDQSQILEQDKVDVVEEEEEESETHVDYMVKIYLGLESTLHTIQLNM